MPNSLLIRNARLANGDVVNILIKNEIISKISKDELQAASVLDAKKMLVLPGLIDPHAHVRDLEKSYKEDWISASKAALAGGNTTIFDMPNTIPPTTNLKNFNLKLAKAVSGNVKFKLNIGATTTNIKELEEILHKKSNVVGAIKVFLASSSDNDVIKPQNLKEIFSLAKEFDKVVIIHTELQECLDKWQNKITDKRIQNHHLIRNRICSIKGTELAVKIASEIKNKLYIAHISTKEEIEIVKNMQNVFAEVTPHHLFLNVKDVEKIGISAKVNPPIRTKADNLALQQAVKDKIIDVIATDHAPHSIEEKFTDYAKSPSGFGGLESKLPLLITAVKDGIFSYDDITRTTAENPAKIFDLSRCGKIKEGYFADITIVDDNAKYKIKADEFHSKSKYSPFDGFDVFGKVKYTLINGKIKYGG